MRKFWDKSEDDILRKYALTHTADEIAKMLPGRTVRAIHHRMGKLGIQRRQVTYAMVRERTVQAIESQIGEPLGGFLRRRYEVEQATYRELCDELVINTRTLMRYMKRFGIKPIDPVTAGKRNYRKHKKIYAYNLSLKNTDDARIKSAKTKQDRWKNFISEQALEIYEALKSKGLYPIPEYAIHRYNIDLAFPEIKLAVEVDGGNWHQSDPHLKKQSKKESYLHKKGWAIIRVGTNDPVNQNVSKISDAVKSRASIHPR